MSLSNFKTNLGSVPVGTVIIVLTHVVGILGFLSPLKDYFIALTPVHLLLSSVLLIIHQRDKNNSFIFILILAYVVGFLVELIGVNTGWIFGNYQYDTALGLKVFNTPLLIGVNWLMLIIAIGSSVSKLKIFWILKAVIASVLMTMLDFLIEPVAIKYDFWHWIEASIPTQNYIGWLIISFGLFLFYFRLPFQKENAVAKIVLLMQLIFFGFLNAFV